MLAARETKLKQWKLEIKQLQEGDKPQSGSPPTLHASSKHPTDPNTTTTTAHTDNSQPSTTKFLKSENQILAFEGRGRAPEGSGSRGIDGADFDHYFGNGGDIDEERCSEYVDMEGVDEIIAKIEDLYKVMDGKGMVEMRSSFQKMQEEYKVQQDQIEQMFLEHKNEAA